MRLLLTILLFAASAFAETPSHFFGQGQAIFRGTNGYCTFNADVEVKGPPEYVHLPYKRAFSYTVRNLTPATSQDANCVYAPPSYTFESLCRAFSMSTGSIGVDVPMLGIITVLPRTPEVREAFSRNAQTGNFGFGVSTIHYKLSTLPDGGLEVFAYVK